MIGSFLTRGLVLVFGYAYPAYECYKTVEKNKPEIEHLLFWCQYWILVAVLTVCERVGDAFISWVPMYSEAKLAFFIYLWYPKTRGTTYVYDSFFRPYVSKHENEIDRNLSELRTLAGDMIVLYWQRAASYGQTRVFEILHYIVAQPSPGPACAAQSKQAPAPHPAQNSQQQHAKVRQPSQAAIRRPAAKKKPPETKEPPSPASSTASIQHQKEVEEEVGPSQVSKQAAPAATSKIETANSASEEPSELREPEAEVMQIEPVPPAADGKTNPAPKETVMDETIRVTRSRLRKARSGGSG